MIATTGNVDDMDQNDVQQVFIFYSSKTEPRLLKMYRDSIDYLEESNIDLEVIDVESDKKTAHEHEVVATPVVIVERETETHRYLGVVDGLQSVLEDDLYGQSILHQLGFKEGRRFASTHDLDKADKDTVEQVLKDHLTAQGASEVAVTTFDRDEHVAVCEIVPGDTDDMHGHEKLEEFLGGCFTEIFDTGVMGVETQCGQNDHDRCEFTVEKHGS